MKLLIALPSMKPGGADLTYLKPIVPAAIEAGWSVDAACSSRTDLEPLVRQLKRDGATHHACEIAEEHCSGLAYLGQQRTFRSRFGVVLQQVRPDVVLLVLPWASYGLGIMQACHAHGVPVVPVFQLVRLGHPGWWRRRRTVHALQRAARLIAVSENNRKILGRMYGLPEDRISVIHNGLDAPASPADSEIGSIRQAVRKELDPGDGPILLTTARLAEQKGHVHLVEAMPRILGRHPDATFVFAGDGPLRPLLQDAVAAGGFVDRVRFLGARDDVHRLLLAADLFVFPTLFEGSPFALIEAMNAGLPIVTTDASGISEVVRNLEDGRVVPAGHSAALADAVIEAMDDPARMQAMAESARERARSFSGGEMARRTLGMLKG